MLKKDIQETNIAKLKRYIRKNKVLFNVLNTVRYGAMRVVKPAFLYLISGSDKPLSTIYGLDRGETVDRFYIEQFLEKHKDCVRGNCLEFLNNNYTVRYGAENVVRSDILDIESTNKNATIIGDVRNLRGVISDNTYDCIILTQVLQFIDDYTAALLECKRILKPGGHILITAPSLGRVDCMAGLEGDFWRFTTASFEYILKNIFPVHAVSSYGNAKIGAAFFMGLSQEDINKSSYHYNDKNFPVIIAAIVKK